MNIDEVALEFAKIMLNKIDPERQSTHLTPDRLANASFEYALAFCEEARKSTDPLDPALMGGTQ